MLGSNPLEVRLELCSVVCHRLGFLGQRDLWCHGKLAVPQSNGFKELLMLELCIGDGNRVVREVERTGHGQDGGIHVKAVLVRHILDLAPLIVGVEVGVAASHHSGLVTLGLHVPVGLGSWQPGRGKGELQTGTILLNYFLLVNLERLGRRVGRGIRHWEAVGEAENY